MFFRVRILKGCSLGLKKTNFEEVHSLYMTTRVSVTLCGDPEQAGHGFMDKMFNDILSCFDEDPVLFKKGATAKPKILFFIQLAQDSHS